MGDIVRDRVQAKLQKLSTRFSENYLKILTEKGDSPFVQYFEGANCEPLEKTFQEFAFDVEEIRSDLRQLKKAFSTVLCIQENSYEILVHICAALLEGKSLCLINPKEGKERIHKKIQRIPLDSLIFVGEEYQAQLGLSGSRVMRKNFSTSHRSGLSVHPPVHFPSDQPFIYIFTSGTTGEPKVVQQLEWAVMLNVDALIERHGLKPGVRLGTCLPVFHVNALEFSFFCTLFSGAEFFFLKNFDLLLFSKLLDNHKLDIFSLVPSLLATILRAERFFPLSSLSSLRYFVTAAAPLSSALIKECYEKMPCRVLQGFGLSEAVNFSAVTPFDLSKDEYEWAIFSKERPSIGTSLRGTDIEVWNEQGIPVSEGQKGELVICGDTLMLGYRGENPLGTGDGRRFPTGDLGFFETYQGKRFYFLTGRKKEIIKRAGLTVSLAEIEDVLSEFSSPKIEAIALGFENDYVGEELAVAFRTDDPNFSVEVLERFMEKKLPSHMRPRLYIEALQAVRSSSGKANRGLFLSFCDKYKGQAFGDTVISVKESSHVH